AHPGSCLDPGRLLLDRRLAVAHLDAQQATSLRCDAHPTSVRSAAKIVDRCRSTTGETSDTPTRRPDSAESDVTPASAIPQGTIWPNQFRSQSALRAKPCMVTPWATRMPMAATLRAGPRSSAGTHTPLRPATRPAWTPNSAH